jgi:hypothetical protein
MINLPLGKALIAVEVDGNMDGMRRCKLCELPSVGQCVSVGCGPSDRRDGKDVIYKLVDWEPEEGV